VHTASRRRSPSRRRSSRFKSCPGLARTPRTASITRASRPYAGHAVERSRPKRLPSARGATAANLVRRAVERALTIRNTRRNRAAATSSATRHRRRACKHHRLHRATKRRARSANMVSVRHAQGKRWAIDACMALRPPAVLASHHVVLEWPARHDRARDGLRHDAENIMQRMRRCNT